MDVHRALELSNGNVMAAAELMAAAVGGKRPADEDDDKITVDAVQSAADRILKQRDAVEAIKEEVYEFPPPMCQPPDSIPNAHPSPTNKLINNLRKKEARAQQEVVEYGAYTRAWIDENSDFHKAVLQLNEMEIEFDKMQKEYFRTYRRLADTPTMVAVGKTSRTGNSVEWLYVGDKYFFKTKWEGNLVDFGIDSNMLPYVHIDTKHFEMQAGQEYLFFTPAY